MLKEFRAFLLRGNLLELAIAFVIGAAFVTVVKALVEDLINPVLAAIGGAPSLDDKQFHIGKGVFLYGSFISAVITFVITAAAVFFLIVKPAQIMLARMREHNEEPPTEPSEEVVLLTEIRNALVARGGSQTA
jgi:large conductance mechanosensitive channel